MAERLMNRRTKEVEKMAEAEDRDENGVETTVVLIGHGSKLPYNKEVLVGLRERMEMRGIFKDVNVAFMQLNSPSIEDVLRTLAKEGKKNIVALPVFLADGAHTTEDIPKTLKIAFEGEWAELGRDVKLTYAKPIGVDERIVDILVDRVKEAVEEG
jgi:sirohydrochlorin ferrochelatase